MRSRKRKMEISRRAANWEAIRWKWNLKLVWQAANWTQDQAPGSTATKAGATLQLDFAFDRPSVTATNQIWPSPFGPVSAGGRVELKYFEESVTTHFKNERGSSGRYVIWLKAVGRWKRSMKEEILSSFHFIWTANLSLRQTYEEFKAVNQLQTQ